MRSDLTSPFLGNSKFMLISAIGESMWPLLVDGELLLVQKCSMENLERGDLALYQEESGLYLAHRYLCGRYFKGDRSKVLERVEPHLFIGRVEARAKISRNNKVIFVKVSRVMGRCLPLWQTQISLSNCQFSLKSKLASAMMIFLNLLSRWMGKRYIVPSE
ncbi:MAG: S24/S26 family peptidase [Bdellovibrionales bacterium]|nr:S24/S26 family peptidase [Bdellovibrionales bacterium]